MGFFPNSTNYSSPNVTTPLPVTQDDVLRDMLNVLIPVLGVLAFIVVMCCVLDRQFKKDAAQEAENNTGYHHIQATI